MSPTRGIVDRFHAAFNARDFDAWSGLLDEDVEITVDAGRFRGREAARAYADGIMRAYPGVVSDARRVVAQSDDTIVSEFHLVNPAAATAGPHGPPATEAWRLNGVVCEIVRLRNDRIVSLRRYYSATETDRTDIAAQARNELHRMADEQSALRRVAELVAGGASPSTVFDAAATEAQVTAAALTNSQARAELQALADQQTALRRVAELVARGAALDEVFTAVAVEASALLGGLAAALQRYDPDDAAVIVAVCNSPAPLGLRVPARAGTGTGYVRRTGKPARVDTFEGTALADVARKLGVIAAVVVPVVVEGRIWGNLSTSSSGPPIPPDTEDRLSPFAELAAVAIANAENKAKLTASRARVVATADETRRRLQRDVHDSAQQRLIHTIITLKLARNAIAAGHGAVELIDEALRNAERASSELRDVIRGILPAALIRGGLRTGLDSLAGDLALSVDVRVAAPRLPAHIETTAYFIVAEALTNVVKHAQATRATVEVTLQADVLAIDVRDDGVGGADPAQGTGLTGLLDRVEAAEGNLTVTSPAGHGTTLHAALPLRSATST